MKTMFSHESDCAVVPSVPTTSATWSANIVDEVWSLGDRFS